MTCPTCGANVVNDALTQCPYCHAALHGGNAQPAYRQPDPKPVYRQPDPKPVYRQPEPKPVYRQPEPKPVYRQPEPQATAGAPRGKMIASMVLGISSVVFSWVSVLGLAAGIVGLVLGVKGKKAAPAGMKTGMGTAGVVCSIIGIVFAAGTVIVTLLFTGAVGLAGLAWL